MTAGQKRRRRIALIAATLGVAGLAIALVFAALGRSVSYFYTPSDLAAAAAPKGIIRLGGLVETGSVAFLNDDAGVEFTIIDERARMRVRYRGLLPDLFREGQGVVVQGRLVDGALDAVEVLAKHDETYMPREVADALKKQGRWKDGEPGSPRSTP